MTETPWYGTPTAQILLLGTFHFKDGSLDRHQPQHGFDVFSERRQGDIAEVVDLLANYQPTKIAIERSQDYQAQADGDYAAYLQGEFELAADEIYQLGFRLAQKLDHKQVYCVNAWDRFYDPPVDLETYMQSHTRQEIEERFAPHMPGQYARDHGQEHLLAAWWPRFQAWLDARDAAVPGQSLREIYLHENREEHIVQSHGYYLVDEFKVGVGHEYPGPDRVTTWYNRNLRIFANLQRITDLPDERILLIIGSGHLPILRHCVQASPEYKLVEVHEYLGAIQ